jgi:hypothetical protein
MNQNSKLNFAKELKSEKKHIDVFNLQNHQKVENKKDKIFNFFYVVGIAAVVLFVITLVYIK